MKRLLEDRNFEDVAAHLTDAVVVTDSKGSIRWCNRAFTDLCGYNIEEVKGHKPGTLLQGKETNPETVDLIHKALNEGSYIQTEILNYHKKGAPYWVSIAITPIHTAAGKVDGFIAIEHDITPAHSEIVEMKEQVVQLYTAIVSAEQSPSSSSNEKDPFQLDQVNESISSAL